MAQTWQAKLFSTGSLKLLIAVGLPASLVWLFTYSQQEANREVKRMKEEQLLNPTSDQITVKNYELKEVDDTNQMKWQLVAKQGIADQDNKSVQLQDVTVSYFDGKNVKLRLIAPVGEANESTRHVKLASLGTKRVAAEGEEGKARLEAETVELTKKNQFVASGGVNIEWPGVAKVRGDSASGQIDLNNLREFKVTGNTHTLITPK